MGKLTELAAASPPPPVAIKRNRVDRILDNLEDDEDRALVMSWLHDGDVGDEWIEDRLRDAGIACSDSTVRRCRIVTSAGRTDDRTITLRLQER